MHYSIYHPSKKVTVSLNSAESHVNPKLSVSDSLNQCYLIWLMCHDTVVVLISCKALLPSN